MKQHYVERAAAALTVRITCLGSARVVRFRRPVDLAEEAYRVIYNYAAPAVERSFGNDIYLWRRGARDQFLLVLADLAVRNLHLESGIAGCIPSHLESGIAGCIPSHLESGIAGCIPAQQHDHNGRHVGGLQLG